MFPPYEGEEEKINPELLGKRLDKILTSDAEIRHVRWWTEDEK